MNVRVGLILVLSVASGVCGIQCGLSAYKTKPLILYGTNVTSNKYPWHVGLYYRVAGELSYKCGGTLITANKVLTAAHCVCSSKGCVIPSQIVIKLGAISRSNETSSLQIMRVKDVEMHKGFHYISMENDLAKIILAGSVEFNEFVQPICLWNSRQTDIRDIGGLDGTVIGWGKTEKSGLSDVLREVLMPVKTLSECLTSNPQFYGSKLSDNRFCAGYHNQGIFGTACEGDSGGGMYFERDGVWRLRGVVSFQPRDQSLNCSLNEFVIFVDTAKYLDWINAPSPIESCGLWQPRNDWASSNAPDIREGDFPWSVSVKQIKNGQEIFRCGGFVLNDNAIITSVACLLEFPNTKLRDDEIAIRKGTINSDSSNLGRLYNVVKTYRVAQEMAIVILDERLPFNGTAPFPSICLPDNSSNIDEVDEMYLVSWRKIPGGAQGRELTMDKKQCRRSVCRDFLENEHWGDFSPFCWRITENADCLASGAKLVAIQNGIWQLLGIVYTEHNSVTSFKSKYRFVDLADYKSTMVSKGLLSH